MKEGGFPARLLDPEVDTERRRPLQSDNNAGPAQLPRQKAGKVAAVAAVRRPAEAVVDANESQSVTTNLPIAWREAMAEIASPARSSG